MKPIQFHTTVKRMLADIYTPVGIYLRLRDKFRDTILLESTDFHAGDNSYSFIAINAIAGIEVGGKGAIEFKLPLQNAEPAVIEKGKTLSGILVEFTHRFQPAPSPEKQARLAQALYGYTSYDAIPLFENIRFKQTKEEEGMPLIRYRLYQYVIVFNHFKNEMFLCENHFIGLESNAEGLESVIKGKDVPSFPFCREGDETSNLTDGAYKQMVNHAIQSCKRGDVFQMVLSRRFTQPFKGDEFNVYRCLRSINPSPYLFYFDYGDYRLMGSSPESQLVINGSTATVHPIAGTFKRTGNDEEDELLAKKLESDEKENAEHVMLVDLARNDLSRICTKVEVTAYKKIQFYSHVIHMVSEVQGRLPDEVNPFDVLYKSFPAGTLSGAPKYKAMQLIDEQEPTARGFYGGAIGMIGLNGDINHSIMIRTFLSRNNCLHYQAGAGVVVSSQPESELQEVNNKLGALKKAITMAETIA
jgi:anthranilate synthase component 1